MRSKIFEKNSIKMQLTLIIALGIFIPVLILIIDSGLKLREFSENAAKVKAFTAAKEYANNIENNLNQVFESINTNAETYKSLLAIRKANVYSIGEIHYIQKQFLELNEMCASVYTILMPGTIKDTSTNLLNSNIVLLGDDHVKNEYTIYDNWDYKFKSNVEDTISKEGGYLIIPPYLDTIGGIKMLVLSYGRGINTNSEFKGLIGIDISINWIQELISKTNLFNNNARISIISNTGNINADNKSEKDVGKNIKDVLPTFTQESKNLFSAETSELYSEGNYIFYVPIRFNKLKSSWHIRISISRQEILNKADQDLYIRIFIISIITFSGLIISYIFFNKLSNRISRLANVARQIAKGTLNQEIELSGNDEISDLSTSLQSIIIRFSNIIKGMKQTFEQLSFSIRELSTTSTKLFEGASEQTEYAKQVSISVYQMNTNIEQNTENAKRADEIAKKSSIEIGASSKNVKNTAISMGEITKKIAVINDIAFQVNILALNASVEAARAGIHGKGFGVVADEVGKLADKSKLSALEIEQLTFKSYSIAKQSGTALEKIVPAIHKTAGLVQDITRASLEQKKQIELINIAIRQLNDITHQTSDSAGHLAINVDSLTLIADKLNKLIAFFKVEDNDIKSDIVSLKKNKAIPKKIESFSDGQTNENEIVDSGIISTKASGKGFTLNFVDEKLNNDELEKF